MMIAEMEYYIDNGEEAEEDFVRAYVVGVLFV